MSELQPPRTVHGIRSVLVQPPDERSVDDPRYSISTEMYSSGKKKNPPSFKPPPPPRSVPTQWKKAVTKQKEVCQQNSSVNKESKKRDKGCNLEVNNADLTQQDYKHVSDCAFFDEDCYISTLGQASIRIQETSCIAKPSDSTTVLQSPNIRSKKMFQMPDAIKRAQMTGTSTNNKGDKSLGTINEDTTLKDNIIMQISVKRETTTETNIDNCIGSAGNGLKTMGNASLNIDSDEIEPERDEDGYVPMRYLGAKKATEHVLSPELRRLEKPKSFRSLSKIQLVRRLEQCGLKDLAIVCHNEKLDGLFLEKHVSDEDLTRDPFLLTRFQIRKLRAIIDGWRPISDFPEEIDSGSN